MFMANTDASAPVWRRNLKATFPLPQPHTMTCVDMAALPMSRDDRPHLRHVNTAAAAEIIAMTVVHTFPV